VANSKISALTSATTPLAGTEVLPIVQSSTTVKVTVDNLTTGRAISALSLNSLTVGLGSGAVATNTAVGVGALNANTSGANNTALGNQALYANTTAGRNTAIGFLTGNANTTGHITAIGAYVLNANTTGTGNTGVGGNDEALSGALQANTTGSYNVGIGTSALGANTTASNNTAVGYQAGSAITTGGNNIYVGYIAQAAGLSESGAIVVGASSTSKGSNTGYINAGGGGVYQGNNSAAWSITSDQRIKKNIVDVTSGLDKILALRPVEFDYKENDKHEVGFIAQEYQQVLPNQVITHAANEAEKQWVDEDGKVMGITQNLVPYLVKAIQELKAEFDAYKSTHP